MPKHILCADDSVTMQKVYSITFAHTDYQVTGARSSDEALTVAQRQRPDLVLADALMPGKTGYDLCMSLKSDPALRGVPVVIVCGNSQPYDEARGKQVGADATLTKPWDTQIFIDKVGEILARTAQHGVAQLSTTAPPVAPTRSPSVPPPRPVVSNPAAPAVAAPVGPSAHPPGLGRPLPPPVSITPPVASTLAGGPAPMRPPPSPSLSGSGAPLPKPPPGLPRPAGISRPPLIRGATTAPRPLGAGPGPAPVRPATGAPLPPPNRASQGPLSGQAPAGLPTPSHATGAAQAAAPQPSAPLNPAQAAAAAAAAAQQRNTQRNATIMGMPAMAYPTAPATPVPPPAAPTPPPPAPIVARPPVPSGPAPSPIGSPPSPMPSTAPPVAIVPEPAPQARPLPGTDALADAAKRVAAAGMLATQQAVQAKGMDPRGVEYDAIAKLSREIIEQIAWEVVPELAEAIIRENIDRLARK